MKLLDLVEDSHELGLRFRPDGDGGYVRVTFGNRGVDIYHAERTIDGTIFQPVTPWDTKTVIASSSDPKIAWQEVKQTIEDFVVKNFRSGSRDARLVGKKLNMWN